jgi:uncharacterized membrane protein
MKKTLSIIALFLLIPSFSMGQEQLPGEGINGAHDLAPETYYRAEVLEILDERYQGLGDDKQVFQDMRVRILRGNEKDQEVEIRNVGGATINGGNGFKKGDKIVINKTLEAGEPVYYVNDIYRIPSLIWITVIFLAVVLFFSRKRGLSSILGLAISVLVILKYVSPQILAGKDPLVTSLIGVVVIAVVSLYLAHGFNKRTSVALLGTLLTLGIATVISLLFVHWANLFGSGSEESIYLQFDQNIIVNLKGLLLGGIMIGVLGVLDDITTAQSAVVDELKKANPLLGFSELYKRASSVGQEHISSLINTLFLAYAGVSLPLFLLLAASGNSPIWTLINSEFISEEIVRTLVGSITLVLAVPITTLLAAYFFAKTGPSDAESGHHH